MVASKLTKAGVLASLLLVLSTPVRADEPPAWRTHFQVFSDNWKFYAEVYPVGGEDRPPAQRTYRLEVKNASSHGARHVLWSSPYHHTGYDELLVADDGSFVIHVERWFAPDGALVYLYGPEGLRIWSPPDLRIASAGLPHSASHILWLEGNPELVVNDTGTATGLRLPTFQGTREIVFEADRAVPTPLPEEPRRTARQKF